MTSMSRDEATHQRSILRQPLFQFLVLGLILFGLYTVFGEKQETESKEIVISSQQVELLASMWEKQWRRPPTPQELEGLIQSFIREEVLYREALAMGLDRDDMVVRRRLAQKIEFLAQDLATQGEPGDAELRTFYQENAEDFEVPATVTFSHVYLNLDTRGEEAFEDAERIVAELRSGADPAQQGDRFMLQSHYADLTQQGVARNFGSKFAEAIFELTPGNWEGPCAVGLWAPPGSGRRPPGGVPAGVRGGASQGSGRVPLHPTPRGRRTLLRAPPRGLHHHHRRTARRTRRHRTHQLVIYNRSVRVARLGDGVGYSDCNGLAATLSRHRASSPVPFDRSCAALDSAPPDEPPERTSGTVESLWEGFGSTLIQGSAWGPPWGFLQRKGG